MVGALRADAHLLKGEADLAADVLAAVLRGDVHISGMVVRAVRGLSVLVQLEEIKLLLGAELEGVSPCLRILDSLLEDSPGVALKGRSVGVGDVAEHADDASVLRPPGKRCQGLRLRMQDQIGLRFVPESRNRRCIKSNPVLKRTGQFLSKDRNVFLPSEHIAKCKPDELHILLCHILQHFLLRTIHDFLLTLRPGPPPANADNIPKH